jgi:hypothetical protein
MVLRDVYQKVGGHAAVASEVLEDVALARRVKRAGYQIYFTAPIGIIRTRMYRSFRALWEGWTKNLYPLMGGRTKQVFFELLEVLPVLELIVAFSVWVLLRGTRPLPLLLLGAWLFAAIAARWARFGVALYRNLYPVSYIKYYVPGMCLYSAALVASWWKNTRGSVQWKGRSYPAGAQSIAQKPLQQRTQ